MLLRFERYGFLESRWEPLPLPVQAAAGTDRSVWVICVFDTHGKSFFGTKQGFQKPKIDFPMSFNKRRSGP
jgi:hypothetical protein